MLQCKLLIFNQIKEMNFLSNWNGILHESFFFIATRQERVAQAVVAAVVVVGVASA